MLVEIKATGICHTDEYTLSGADPEGLFPAILGHEGAGIVRRCRPRRDPAEEGRSRHPALHARMPAVQVLPVAQDQSLHRDPRHPGQGRDARRHQPLLLRRQADLSTTWAARPSPTYTVLPEIALAKIREDAPFDKVCYIGCGVTTGIGAVINTAKVEPGANVVVFGLGGIGLNVVQGARMAGADMIVGVDLNPARKALAEQVRHDPFRQPEGGRGRPGGASGRADRRRRRLQLRVHRQRRGDAPGAGMLPSRLGRLGHHRRRRRRAGDRHPPVPAGHRAASGRAPAFGGARGRTDVPKIVDWYMDGKINIDDLITHVMPLDEINEGFDLMHEGKSIRIVVVYDAVH